MNKEYIEREAIIQEIKKSKNNFSPIVRPIFDVAAHLISHAPAADVAPVVHGEWVLKNDGRAHCSVCNTTGMAYAWSFCPNCGARMDEGNK